MSRLGLKPGDLRLLSSDMYIAQNRFKYSRGFKQIQVDATKQRF